MLGMHAEQGKPETMEITGDADRFCIPTRSEELGTGAVGTCVTLCDLVSRVPLRFVYGKSAASEHKLIKKLVESHRKNDLLLLDAGFCYCSTFVRIPARRSHFINPAKTTTRPQALSTLSPGDCLCRIIDLHSRKPLTVRAVFAYRNGFLRRLIPKSLKAAAPFFC
jgi:hypothetical protein